ncbi:M23 family metallopeptidase [Pseudenhygromyxa sp. WMMC2535]|uniref:M23 family metallopeptidase n=1 Tax=Pseudenhygromyxa sp. WMMC2535 TaxID=2712867 RepID=UPI001552FBA8|nr:peptidoglycan DD-metalloendopeptidase family protein [Pseudenhygromyxa sp. WMMC2535]NVB41177.1 M23 family metallopeptidase [Pseudenhygromyxa sp. WMMC2535]
MCIAWALTAPTACEEPANPFEDQPRATDAPTEPTPSTSASDPGDPFTGPLAAWQPAPWSTWPLEAVDIDQVSGWRISPISGQYEQVSGLHLRVDADAYVLAIADGRVSGQTVSEDGGVFVTVDHDQGVRSELGPLREASVHAQLPVTRGAVLGLAAGPSLTLRTFVDGVQVDPLTLLRQPLRRWPAMLERLPPPPAEPDPSSSPALPQDP